LSHDAWEYENAKAILSHHIPEHYVVHATPLGESQFRAASYGHPHTPCTPISCNYCYSFNYDVDSYSLLGRTYRLEALTTFNTELHLHNLRKTNLSLGPFKFKVMPYEDIDAWGETPIPLGHDFHVNANFVDLEEASDPSSPLAVAPSLDLSIVSDSLEVSLIINNPPLPLVPLGEPEEGERLEPDATFDASFGIFIESEDSLPSSCHLRSLML